MQQLAANEVELSPNELWVVQRHNEHLDEGYALVAAAELAMLDFWYAFPGAEEDTANHPFSWAFFHWLVGGEVAATEALVVAGWTNAPHYMDDLVEGSFSLLDFCRAHTEATVVFTWLANPLL